MFASFHFISFPQDLTWRPLEGEGSRELWCARFAMSAVDSISNLIEIWDQCGLVQWNL